MLLTLGKTKGSTGARSRGSKHLNPFKKVRVFFSARPGLQGLARDTPQWQLASLSDDWLPQYSITSLLCTATSMQSYEGVSRSVWLISLVGFYRWLLARTPLHGVLGDWKGTTPNDDGSRCRIYSGRRYEMIPRCHSGQVDRLSWNNVYEFSMFYRVDGTP